MNHWQRSTTARSRPKEPPRKTRQPAASAVVPAVTVIFAKPCVRRMRFTAGISFPELTEWITNMSPRTINVSPADSAPTPVHAASGHCDLFKQSTATGSYQGGAGNGSPFFFSGKRIFFLPIIPVNDPAFHIHWIRMSQALKSFLSNLLYSSCGKLHSFPAARTTGENRRPGNQSEYTEFFRGLWVLVPIYNYTTK